MLRFIHLFSYNNPLEWTVLSLFSTFRKFYKKQDRLIESLQSTVSLLKDADGEMEERNHVLRHQNRTNNLLIKFTFLLNLVSSQHFACFIGIRMYMCPHLVCFSAPSEQQNGCVHPLPLPLRHLFPHGQCGRLGLWFYPLACSSSDAQVPTL